jgi:hypothetical protein
LQRSPDGRLRTMTTRLKKKPSKTAGLRSIPSTPSLRLALSRQQEGSLMSPRPIALTDSQITAVMQLSRPLTPDQRIAFVEMLTAKLNGHHEIGDGMLYQLCRELQRELFSPPFEESHGRIRGAGKYSR